MTRPHILREITRLARNTAWRVSALARRSQFTAEELLADITTEARSLLMQQKWQNMGPPEKNQQTPNTPPHHPKIPTKGGHQK